MGLWDVVVPESIVIEEGQGNELREMMEAFYEAVITALDLSERERLSFARIRHSIHHFLGEDDGKHCATDDWTELLVVNDRIVASVMSIRTPFNYSQICFAVYQGPALDKVLSRFEGSEAE